MRRSLSCARVGTGQDADPGRLPHSPSVAEPERFAAPHEVRWAFPVGDAPAAPRDAHLLSRGASPGRFGGLRVSGEWLLLRRPVWRTGTLPTGIDGLSTPAYPGSAQDRTKGVVTTVASAGRPRTSTVTAVPSATSGGRNASAMPRSSTGE